MLFNAAVRTVGGSRHRGCIVFWFVVVLVAGCGRAPSPEAKPPMVTADMVMQRMVDAYRRASAYRDEAQVRLAYRRDGQSYEDTAPLSVAWEAPNRLRVRAYQVDCACDGNRLTARIEDEVTRNFDGQVVVRDAPRRLTLGQLWEEDAILSLAFRQGLAGYPLQLDLLLSPTPLAALRDVGVQRSLHETGEVEGKLCDRVRVDTPDGRFVLWVDQETYLLRRIEYPAAAFAPEIAEDTAVEDLRLTVEFRQAAFEAPRDDATFAFSLPPAAKQVRRLIMPPRELPSELIGRTTAPYLFTTLTGENVSHQSLGERVKVFVWFNNHPACRSAVQQLNHVYRQYQSQADVAIHAVCVEALSVTDQQIDALAQSWQVELPIVRDLQAVGRDLFQVPWAPTLIVLDRENVVQVYEVGANPNLVGELPQILEQLLAGEDVAGAILDQYRNARTAYERALQRGEPETPAAVTTTAVASRSTTRTLQLRPLWKSDALTAPGNILAVRDAEDAVRFLVHEGYRAITEIGGQGSVIARRVLDLPPQAAVSHVSAALSAAGQRYYVAWSLRSPQAHVFDERWQRVLSYPGEDIQHEGVQEALLDDLDGDGQLELHVGFWGARGVDCVTLNGNLLWRNQDMLHVLSLMSTAGDGNQRELWVTSAAGTVTRLDRHGRGEPVAEHTGQLIHHVFPSAADPEQSDVVYCGIAYGLEGRRLAIGLDHQGISRWRYSLPAGAFGTHIRFVTSAPLLDEQAGCWLIAGADGSVHIIGEDGRLTDHFQTGEVVTGLAGGRQAGAGLLLVSSPQGIQAWQVSPPATARRP